VLFASPDTLHARLRHPHIDHESGLDWHLAGTGELDSILDGSDVAEIEIAVDALTRDDAATTVLVIGWTDWVRVGPIWEIASDSQVLQRCSRMERVTGIEPALSAWEEFSGLSI
jgi:hypothetical protein